MKEDIDSLLAKGHELASQTFDHSSCRAVSLSGREGVEEIAGHGSANFAYPYGHVTLWAKRKLGPELTSSRGIFPGLNGPEIDLSLLRANRLYGDVDECGQDVTVIGRSVLGLKVKQGTPK